MHYITDAVYVTDHKIKIRFEDGQVKLVDLRPYLDGPIFEPLKDIRYFRLMTVNRDIDTITWPNGADFSPDFLFEIGVEVDECELPMIHEEGSEYGEKEG